VVDKAQVVYKVFSSHQYKLYFSV